MKDMWATSNRMIVCHKSRPAQAMKEYVEKEHNAMGYNTGSRLNRRETGKAG